MDFYASRKWIIVILFSLTFLTFLVQLYRLQILSPTYQELAARNAIRKVTVYPDRGLIYDRKGRLLVFNDAVYDLYVIPSQVKNIDTTLFCQLLDIDLPFFREQLASARKFYRHKPSVFIRQIKPEEFSRFQEYLYQFPGFYGEIRTIRKYAYPSAAHVFGYIGEVSQKMVDTSSYYQMGDFIGVSGLESTYETYLRGKRGHRYVLVDVLNREQGSYQNGALDTVSIAGSNLKISLDIALQMYGEQLMQNKKGSIVAIEPTTGEILAMVSSPGYDPNLLTGRKRGKHFAELLGNPLQPLFNRPIMAFYPPGSTFKAVMALVGLQEGTIRVNEGNPCALGYAAKGLFVKCRPHPSISNLSLSLQYSCNAYYCHHFRKMIDQPKFKTTQEGFDRWVEYMYSFGLGKPLGIDITSEDKGNIPTTAYYNRIYKGTSWKSITIISLGIGQGEMAATPIQMANLMAIISNKGRFITPHFLVEVDVDTTAPIRYPAKDRKTLVDTAHFEPVIQGLYNTVEQGTARASRIPNLTMGGKTGTAQNPVGEDNSLFIAFAPVDQPKIAIAVVVENAGGGSKMAAPIASLMVEKYLTDTIQNSRKAIETRILETNLIAPRVPQ